MPLIEYEPRNFKAARLAVIDAANAILQEYHRQGYDLTLRQLYYQFVSRDLIRNSDQEYNKLGSTINDARLAGLVDWNHITDRTRFVRAPSSWEDPASIIRGSARGYQIDVHEDQPVHIEVWVEKDALSGVVERACRDYRLSWLSCRGYMSQSEMWQAAQRFGSYLDEGKRVVILHLGDHDPSGVDMTRDIDTRISNFLSGDGYQGWDSGVFEVDRIALTMEQVEQYDPPPNPAKLTDSRGTGYVERYGNSSWELDALEPRVLHALINAEAELLIDSDRFEAKREREEKEREDLTACSDRWNDVLDFLGQ